MATKKAQPRRRKKAAGAKKPPAAKPAARPAKKRARPAGKRKADGKPEPRRNRYGTWDEQTIGACLAAIEQGVPTIYAAMRAGIHRSTWYRHINAEGAPDGQPPNDADILRQRVAEAEARGIAVRVARVSLAATGRKAQFDAAGNCLMPAIPPNWNADRWMLSVRWPDEFGTRDRLQVGGDPDQPVQHIFKIEYVDIAEPEPGE